MSLRKFSGLMLLAVAGTPAMADAQQAFENLEKQLVQPPAASANAAEEPGYLGIIADDRDTQGRGIRLIDVLASGPSARAGLQVGDIITSIDGVQVKSLDDMAKVMAGRVVNEEVSFVATRGIEAVRVDVVLTKRPPPEERRFGNFGRIGDPNVAVVTPNAPAPPSIVTAPSVPSVDSLPPPEAIASLPRNPSQTPATIAPAMPRGAKPIEPTLPAAPAVRGVPSVPETVDPDAPLTPIAPGDEVSPAAGHLRTGLLGVRTTRITPEVQLAYNLPAPRGALVVEVRPDSPAKLAGIPVDAVIVAAGGRRVDIPDDLAAAVAERGPGAELRVSYYRYGQLYEKTVTLVAPLPVVVARPMVVGEVPTTPAPGPAPSKMEPSVGLPPSTVPPAAIPPSTKPPATTPTPLAPPFGAGPTLAPPQPTVSLTTPKAPVASTTPTVATDSETAQIRKQIRELEAQLKALEKRLPPEEKK
jgi:S1-C subfamily serine protease